MKELNKDEQYIRYCIKLAENSLQKKENPFGCIIVQNKQILIESGNLTKVEKDVSRHAEINALKIAQDKLGDDLSACELYSNCEPCVMCAFVIRELRIKKVVFALHSPLVGGYSRWNVLQDEKLAKIYPYGDIPEVISGILSEEAEKIFRQIGWNQMFQLL